jgi:sugar/nucleoside kinase (ribokinase family)
VTLGERGLVWYDEAGNVRTLPALAVPSNCVLDTSGAGDVFHGAYVYSFLADASKHWEAHFRFGRAASAYKIQHLGNEAGLPTLADVATAEREFTVGKSPAFGAGHVPKKDADVAVSG